MHESVDHHSDLTRAAARRGLRRLCGLEPLSGYEAMALGIVFLVLVGSALMGLIFYSSRYGYDEPQRH
jgi:hypothetical protein